MACWRRLVEPRRIVAFLAACSVQTIRIHTVHFMTIVPFLAQSAFDPEVIEILAAAFEDAWASIEKSGSSLASPRYKRVAQEIMAKRIIETAQRGERDRQRLAEDAVTYLTQSYK
jgi:hypothetical protein